jgi:hypothetical protein
MSEEVQRLTPERLAQIKKHFSLNHNGMADELLLENEGLANQLAETRLCLSLATKDRNNATERVEQLERQLAEANEKLEHTTCDPAAALEEARQRLQQFEIPVDVIVTIEADGRVTIPEATYQQAQRRIAELVETLNRQDDDRENLRDHLAELTAPQPHGPYVDEEHEEWCNGCLGIKVKQAEAERDALRERLAAAEKLITALQGLLNVYRCGDVARGGGASAEEAVETAQRRYDEAIHD